LPVAPTKRRSATTVATGHAPTIAPATVSRCLASDSKSSVHSPVARPIVHTSRNRPMRNAASPTRFTRNAFFPATAFSTLSYQKLIRR
jgi:hypothetical protein